MDVLRLFNLMLVTLSSLQPFLCHGLKKARHVSDNVGAEDPGIQEERPPMSSHSARTAACNGTGQPWSVSRHP